MPTYDYECTKCGYSFEVFQKISEEPLQMCPECKGKLKKLIGAGCGLIFKGSGFYITDYKRKGNNKENSCQAKDNKCNKESCPKSDKK
jgi:putative FmdB family regulatory protein